MGYSPSRQIIRDNREHLERVLIAVQNQEPFSYGFNDPDELKKNHWKLRRTLKSAEAFKDEFDGRYRHLAGSVSLSEDLLNCTLWVIPKEDAMAGAVTDGRRAEQHALQDLDRYQGEFPKLTFFPTDEFNEDHFAALCLKRGFKLILPPFEVNENTGERTYYAERVEKEKKSLFDMIGSAPPEDQA